MGADLIYLIPPDNKVGGEIVPGAVVKRRGCVFASQTPKVKDFSAFCITQFSLESPEFA